MDFSKSEEQQLLLESIDEFLSRCEYGETYFKECYDNNRMCKEFLKALLDGGFGMLGIPEEFGGTEVDLQTLIMLAERITEQGYPADIIINALQIDDMLTFGNEEQKKVVFDYLLAEGCECFSLAITEPQAGSDNHAMTTSATRRDGKVIINGHKCFISKALESPYMLCMAREADMEGNPMSMYFIPSNSPGVKIQPMHKIGNKMGSMCDVYLEDVVLPESALVGQKGNGFFQLMKNFEIERLVSAAMVLGMAQCAFNDAAAYANQREQFGKPIGSFQMIQEKITQMYIKLMNMRNMVYYAAWQKDNKDSIRTTSALAKLYCAQAGFEVVDDAMQIMGGIGYTEDHRISRFWRDIRVHRIWGGTDQMMVHIASRQILKEYQN